MDLLRKFWPMAFSIEKKNTKNFVINLIIFIAICIVGGVIIGVLGWLLPIVWPVWTLIGTVLDLYGLAGVVFSILKFVGVFE